MICERKAVIYLGVLRERGEDTTCRLTKEQMATAWKSTVLSLCDGPMPKDLCSDDQTWSFSHGGINFPGVTPWSDFGQTSGRWNTDCRTLEHPRWIRLFFGFPNHSPWPSGNRHNKSNGAHQAEGWSGRHALVMSALWCIVHCHRLRRNSNNGKSAHFHHVCGQSKVKQWQSTKNRTSIVFLFTWATLLRCFRFVVELTLCWNRRHGRRQQNDVLLSDGPFGAWTGGSYWVA
jgi:hypothetical protein